MSFLSIAGYEPQHLSFSTLNSYRMCGAMTYFQKVAGLEQHPGFAAIGGNAVHEASEAVERIIMKGGYEALDQTSASVLDTHTSSEDSGVKRGTPPRKIGPDSVPDF